MSKSFFSTDGSWGEAEDILIVDTDNWPEWWVDAIDYSDDFCNIMAYDILKFVETEKIEPYSMLYRWAQDYMPELLDTKE